VANPLTVGGAVDGDMILRRVAAGSARPILVADIPAFSSAPPLSNLVSSRTEDRPLYQVDPLGALSQDRPYISIADLAAEAAGSFGRSRPAGGPVFVIGYCSAAALSLHIATLLARSREAIAVLLRPSWPEAKGIEETFATRIRTSPVIAPWPASRTRGSAPPGVRRKHAMLHKADIIRVTCVRWCR